MGKYTFYFIIGLTLFMLLVFTPLPIGKPEDAVCLSSLRDEFQKLKITPADSEMFIQKEFVKCRK